MSCNNTNPIPRNYVERTTWDLHHRTAYNNCGYGTHGGTHSEEFNRASTPCAGTPSTTSTSTRRSTTRSNG